MIINDAKFTPYERKLIDELTAAKAEIEKWKTEAMELAKIAGNASRKCDEHWAGTPEQEIETLRKMVEQRDAEIERLRGRIAEYMESLDAYIRENEHLRQQAAEKGGDDD